MNIQTIHGYEKISHVLEKARNSLFRDSPADCVDRGLLYLHEGDYHPAVCDIAIQEFNYAIEQVPDYADAYNYRAMAYNYVGNYDQAIADYDRAIEFQPADFRVYNNRGIAYFNREDYDRAITDLNEAIRLCPSHTVAYLNRGSIYHVMADVTGEYGKALEDYDNAVRLCPNYVDDFINDQFLLVYGTDSIEKAIKLLDSVINPLGESADAYYYTGVKVLFENDRLSAERYFQIALKLGYGDCDKINQHLENLKTHE